VENPNNQNLRHHRQRMATYRLGKGISVLFDRSDVVWLRSLFSRFSPELHRHMREELYTHVRRQILEVEKRLEPEEIEMLSQLMIDEYSYIIGESEKKPGD
jgi:hypothetical protein